MDNKKGKLVMCPTPLGNLGDMPARALEALQGADVVCCEDTRVTGKLLAALGIEGKRLERMDESTMRMPVNRMSMSGGAWPDDDCVSVGDALVGRVLEGQTVVYCSDAGMPGVSDPGQYLVSLARECGAVVEVLPGPTAVATAYVASGFVCPRFYFGGFFPRKEGQRAQVLALLDQLDAVCIFYESPHRLCDCLDALAKACPHRRVAVCRELTKLHEEVVVGTARELAQQFKERAQQGDLRGEIVVVVDEKSTHETADQKAERLEAAAVRAQELLQEGGLSKKDLASQLCDEYGISRNAAYKLVHTFHNMNHNPL